MSVWSEAGAVTLGARRRQQQQRQQQQQQQQQRCRGEQTAASRSGRRSRASRAHSILRAR
ncbi:hypothetical protein A6R68_20481 [Neotoma lepida]|uniref:Uncharacterized protein n=1 Tax=Neotoma lepida TaxID=56216 RepID=A0A1A6HSW5_NEOLE|nr:hypothetical protein A6R68_20481 [Neotoma lepida]